MGDPPTHDNRALYPSFSPFAARLLDAPSLAQSAPGRPNPGAQTGNRAFSARGGDNTLPPMRRIMIIGNAAGGKSRLARRAARAYGLPLRQIDLAQWRPGWVMAPERDVTAIHNDWLAKDRWVIDGFGPWPTIRTRMQAADLIILVDLPLATHLRWAAKRQICSIILGREDGPPGCPMWRATIPMLRLILRFHRETRPKLLATVAEVKPPAKTVHLRNPSDLAAFTRSLPELLPSNQDLSDQT